MLQICRSNRVETLLDLLAHRLGETPLASPFTPETVVTPSPAMARWVHLGLAGAHGVAANLVYPLPASFVWQLARDLLGDTPEADPMGLEPMAWRIYAALPALLPNPAFAPLRHYLQPVADAVKRWQLAERIADAFDRYQLYRPDLIRAWSQPDGTDQPGRADAWQPLLWRGLTTGLEGHRVAVIDRLLALLTAEALCPGLPERVSLFAVSSLPPLLVEVVQALAGHTRVDLYLHAPTDQFWADLVDQKAQARRRLEHPDDADLWEVGNPLLASWGRQGQALQDLLLSREVPALDAETWVPPAPDCLLHRIQGDIYSLTGPDPEGSREAVAPDGSFQVQICYSPLRECQVLHDRLLSWFEAEPDLRPEDCLVMVPEIDAYAPYIEAVFERDPSAARPHIPWNLSDVSLRAGHPLILVFLQILDLPNSRFGQAEVLSYLDVPELAATFGLDPDDVARIKGWLAQARLRWGLDAGHKARLGLPEVAENTWAQAERRLFGGYALAGVADPETNCDPA
ncbi:MAG TPA: exodeoxyribonuclease V subunit gamma, partial [Chromatiaceae bacterium]|nr:exodeoxyribonuclease V subunit gamma [Chromatiaceae bacterium]